MKTGFVDNVEIVLMNLLGTTESFVVTPMELNQFCCVYSPDFVTDFRILHGDIFVAEKLVTGNYQLVHMVKTGVMRHFRLELGMYLMPITLKDQEAAKKKAFDALGDYFDNTFINRTLKAFLHDCGGCVELNELVQCYYINLHLPESHVAVFFERLGQFFPRFEAEDFVEIFSEECDD